MTAFYQTRRCPFCGAEIVLAECLIVDGAQTTVTLGNGTFSSSPLGGDDGGLDAGLGNVGTDGGSHAGAVDENGRFGGRAVLALAPAAAVGTRSQRLLRRTVGTVLPPAEAGVPYDRFPVRSCYKCATALPRLIDERELFTVALVGTKRSGKSHFLTSMYHEGVQEQRGAAYGIAELSADEASIKRLDQHYYVPMYFQHRLLQGTDEYEANAKPFVFKVTVDGYRPVGLVLHDVAGESLDDIGKRRELASFTRRADGVVFLIDPLSLPGFRAKAGITTDDAPYANQAAMLEALLSDLATSRHDIPVVLALSKSDAVSRLLGRSHTFDEPLPSDPGLRVAQAARIDGEVRSILRELGGNALLHATRDFSTVGYRAVAAIGSEPIHERIETLKPRRCLEPMLGILGSLCSSGRIGAE